jgi:putative FmdB family regulatory protein
MPIFEYKCTVCGKVFESYLSSQSDIFISQKCPKPSCNGMGSKIYSSFSIGNAHEQEIPVSQDKFAVLIAGIVRKD